ncbi:endonuclease, partial [bacterium]|nr:endonuclease [bacterium]
MKSYFKILILLLTLSTMILAQIPMNYYDNATNLNGDSLKTALYDIVKGHTQKSYGDARYILDESDADPNNSNNVRVIYSNHSVSGTWDDGVTWNREHVWASSRGIGEVSNITYGAGSDLHNLRACIPSINTARSNRWLDYSTTPYLYNGESTGSYTNTSNWAWQPRNEDKGDVARILFYMASRYEGENG